MNISTFRLRFCAWLLLGVACVTQAWAVPTKLGDLDDDDTHSANDLAKLVAHSSGAILLSETLIPFADLNQDGAVNNTDQEELVKLILESREPQTLPLAKVRQHSPYSDEGDVSVTRETVVQFTMPLSLTASLDPTQFYADANGRRILSRVEIASDRRKATLFFLEPLPSNSRVRVVMEPTTLKDLLNRDMDLDGDGVAGGNLIFTFDTLSITALPGTAIHGRVLASERTQGGADIPIAGVTIMVDGAEETIRTTTDANGNFVLNPCPAGSFFVHVDGRTSPASSYPGGNYYPSVGKRWDAVAGSVDNLSGNITDPERGKIYLPLIHGAALVAVSAMEATPVEFPEEVLEEHPELEGTHLTVPPNSLFADDGTRGGSVGIAAVDPERLPSPLPEGLDLPMVITIQTDGASNFDIPVPITFPNLPDPETGDPLPPGAKSALFSFNHDTGEWEVVGAMTVSEDGLFVTTDAGVGIKQPGWHGTAPGSGGNGPPPRRRPPPPPPEDPPCPDKSAWDYANLVYDVGKEVAGCAIEFAKAKEALKCIFTLVDLTKNMLVGAANIGDALGSGENMAALEHLLGIIEADLADTEALIGCANAASPFSRATAAFECVGNALNIADSLCQFNDDPSTPPKCRAGYGARKFCAGIQLARSLHTEIKIFVDLAKGAGEHAVLAGAVAVVKQTKFLLESIRRKRALDAGAGGGAPPPPPLLENIHLTPEEIAQVKAQIGLLQKELLKLQAFANDGKKLIGAVDNFQKQADTMVSEVSTDLAQFGQPIQRSSYYLITVDEVPQRGRTSNSGGLSLIMAPDARYSLHLYDPVGKEIGSTLGATGANGSNIDFNGISFQSTAGMLDDDSDGLVNQAENIVGTSPLDNDSDNDGILDGAEVEQGSDPLGGMIAQTGIVATVPQTAPSQHITTANNMAVISHRAAGISIYNIANPLTPALIQLYDTPGSAEAAVIAGNMIAVADTSSVLILSATDQANIVQRHMVTKSNADFVSMATDGALVYAGTNNGKIHVIDLASGSILGEVSLSNGDTIMDLAVWRGRLYAVQIGRLSTINLDTLTVTGNLPLAGNMGAGQRKWRLFAGDGTLYATHTSGFNIVDTATTPDTPSLVSNFNTAAFGWKQIVGTGNGLGVAAVSPNSTDDGPHEIDLYTLGADQRTPAFNTTFITPGLAAAVSLFNGLAYVADSGTGLQVLSFKAFDSQGIAPAISISANIPLNQGSFTSEIESGKPVRVYATATDDVLVRNVEFYIDGTQNPDGTPLQVGTLVQVDGNYPFEGGFNAPVRSPSRTSFTLRAKVSDTGGNSTWSPLYTIAIIPDLIPPLVKRTYPSSIGGLVKSVLGVFNEPLDPGTVTASSVQLTFAGPDGVLDAGGDDTPVTAQSIVYRDDINAVSFTVAEVLPQGLYRGRLTTALKDASDNALASNHTWTFTTNNSSSIFTGTADGTYNWNDAANWSTGTVPGAGSVVIIDAGPGVRINLSNATLDRLYLSIQGGAQMVLSSNVTLHDLTLNGDLRIEGAGTYVSVTGGLTFDDGRLIMASPGMYNTQTLNIPSPISFSGNGELVINQNSGANISSSYGFTLGAGVTTRIGGYANFQTYYSTDAIVNQGTLIMDSPEASANLLNFDNQGTINIPQGKVYVYTSYYNFHNHAALNLSATGQLIVYGYSNGSVLSRLGTITRNGGAVILQGTIDLEGETLALNASTGSWSLESGTLKNGTVTTSGGAVLNVTENTYAVLENIDIQGSIVVAASSTLTLQEDWQNHGTITLNNATLRVGGSFPLSDVGVIIRNNSKVQIFGTIENTGQTIDPGALPNSFTLDDGTIKGGTVAHAGPGPVVMKDQTSWNFDGVTLSSDLKVGWGCDIEVSNGLTLNNANIFGLSEIQPEYSHLNLYFKGSQTVSGNGSILFDTAEVDYISLNIQVNPVYDYNAGVYLPSEVTFGPSITTRFGKSSSSIYATNSTTRLTHQGPLHFEAGGNISIYGNFVNAGTMHLSSGIVRFDASHTEGNAFENTGTINLSGTGTLNMGGTFTLAQLGTVNRTGGTMRIIGTLDLTPSGTLSLNAATGSWELGAYLESAGGIKGGTVTTTGGTSLLVKDSAYGRLDGTTLQGTVNVTTAGTLIMQGDWVNQGVINVTDANIQWGGEFRLTDLGVVNRTGNTTMTISAGTLDNSSSSFQLDNTTITLGQQGTVKGGTVTCSDPGYTLSQYYPDYATTLDGVTVASSFQATGFLHVKNGLMISPGVTVTMRGCTVYATGTQTFGGGGTLLYGAPIYYGNFLSIRRKLDAQAEPAHLTLASTFTIRAQNSVNMSAVYGYAGDSLINQGVIEANGAVIRIQRPFANSGTLQETSGGTVIVHD